MGETGRKTKKIYYSMGEVSEMFDVNPSLIRFWEQKFSILKPEKNKKGNRLFTQQDVDNLKLNAALSVSWSPWKFLTLEGKAAPRFNVSHTHQFDDVIRYASDAFGTQSPVTSRLYNELTESQTQNFYMTWQFTAAFHKDFASGHDLKVLLGASRETFSQRY